MKRKALILTLNDYIIYQPTILNLYDSLSTVVDVSVVSFEPKFVTKQREETRNIIYLKTSSLYTQFYTKADFIFAKLATIIKRVFPRFTYQHLYYNRYLPSVLHSFLNQTKPIADIVIAVDLAALRVAQKHFGRVHFLSLELEDKSSALYRSINTKKILSVFIQSQMRYDYLFGNARLTTFIIQNAPVYVRPPKQADRKHFIWAGTIHRSFAVLDCVEFFKQYPEYTLVLKGGEEKKTRKFIDDHYKILLEQGRIVIDRSYLPSELFIDFLATFKIGFCFYSWDLINSNFNYKSAPSGKLFMYLAAGTPVIACNIPGFDFIREYGAGVLIDDYNPATIEKAVRQIQDNYDDYSRACIKAAQYFSFAKHVAPYIQFLLTTTSEAE